MAYELENITILNIKCIDNRYVIWSMTRNDTINRLYNSELDDQDHYEYDVIKAVGTIKEWAYGRTYFRDIYVGINGKWYRKSWTEFDELKNVDKTYYSSNYYEISINRYGVKKWLSVRLGTNWLWVRVPLQSLKSGTSLRFWEDKDWINSIDPCGWFQWYFRYWFGR